MGLNHQYIQRIDISGRIFSFASTNITYVPLQHHLLVVMFIFMSRNNAEFLAYIQSNYFNGSLTTQQLTDIGLAYPDNITKVISSAS